MFTNDEINLMCIYNTGTREGLIAELTQMRGYLGSEETELLTLTDSALGKLRNMSDTEYAKLDLLPDFDVETE
ncbi:transposon-transfer assisting family protein [Caproiciproducens galactitolivorans]|uniref:Transposon-transfer assisting family protein n=1 Tax=Caproiciproducens galactitolivorans TaxID=642589 RepID=A0ABT4BX40_9FIRM|nr:transposon-transfer assisting family protein [Caproiciproducens galactitolivorans]MCY1714895.1 transposon-transfer assisting family protein [Caproiciproducens galactitolivorans]